MKKFKMMIDYMEDFLFMGLQVEDYPLQNPMLNKFPRHP